jgi:RNA-binding protein
MISPAQKKTLKSLAHHLKPLLQIGKNGLSPEFITSASKILDDHELVKIKFLIAKEKNEKAELITEITSLLSCEHIGTTGNVAIIYRESGIPEKRIYSKQI